MLIVITWYLAMQLFAFAAWPLAFSVCDRLADRGYALAKGLGLLLVTYITWSLAHLAGQWPVLGFSFATVSAAWIALLLLSLLTIVRRITEIWSFIRRRWRYMLCLEVVMLAGLLLMTALRAQVPHISYHVAVPMPDSVIDHAAEKFMDFAILNGLLTSSAFPPHDVWVGGQSLNYYYFGHMLWAVLVKFSSIRPEIGYNLALGAVCALICALSFGLGYNLTGRKRWGFMTLFLIVISSNLDGFWQFVGAIKHALVAPADVMAWYGLDRPWWQHYDFWRSSRAIAGTINEFPAFSLLLGDLHAHVSALVINLCGWHVAIQIFRSARQYRSLWRYEVNAFDELFFAALILGALSATNSWDVPLYAGIVALAMWSGATGRRDPYAYLPGVHRTGARLGRAASALFITGLLTVVGVGLLFAPFLINFQPPKPPDGAMIKMVMPTNRTNPFEFFTHWAMLITLPIAAILVAITSRRRPIRSGSGAGYALALLVVAAGFVLMPVWQGWIVIISAAAVLLLSGILAVKHLPPTLRFLCGIMLLFSLIIWFCELFYVDDVFEGEIERINTVFKTYYGLWPMMSVATILSLQILIRTGCRRTRHCSPRRRAVFMVVPLLIAGSPYIVLGTIHRINSATRLGQWEPPADTPTLNPPAAFMKPEARPKSLAEALDGMRYLAYTHPHDYLAMLWIRDNIPPDAILLEAAGAQYTYSGRISTMTGRQAFAGWLNHSLGWRGNTFRPEQQRRYQRTADIYLERDPAVAAKLLHAENIDYVIIGPQEQQQYPGMNAAIFDQIGQQVYSRGELSIYRIDK